MNKSMIHQNSLLKNMGSILMNLTGAKFEIEFLKSNMHEPVGTSRQVVIDGILFKTESSCISFSKDSVYQIVDVLTGGSKSHWTNIENKPFSDLEGQLLDFVLSFVCKDLTKVVNQDNAAIKIDELFPERYASELLFSHFALKGPKRDSTITIITAQSNQLDIFPQIPNRQQLPTHAFNFSKIKLDDEILIEWLCGELPQVGALVLSLISKEQASKVLMTLPQVLAVDIASRYFQLDDVSKNVIGLVVRYSLVLGKSHACYSAEKPKHYDN